MPSNTEIKSRVADPVRFREIAEQLSDQRDTIRQKDVFFASPRGRLKLRFLDDGIGELIYYERSDQAGPKQSQYSIARTDDPESLCEVLSGALGVVGTVRKVRELFLVGQTRIHLDEVEGLGTFAELEVVMREGQAAADGTAIASDLMQKLGIGEEDLVDVAYVDLLARQGGAF